MQFLVLAYFHLDKVTGGNLSVLAINCFQSF